VNYDFWNTLTPEQQTFYTELAQGYALGQLFSDHSAGWDAIWERIDEVRENDGRWSFASAIDTETIVVWGCWAENALTDFADAIESLARDFLEAQVGAMWAYSTQADKGKETN
jgi:hypothetical protein